MENTPNEITDLPGVFALFGTNVKLAAVIGVGISTVSEMKRRGNIPVEYWLDICNSDEGKAVELTMRKMAYICAEAAIARRKEKKNERS